MVNETVLVRCRHCGTRNRIPATRLKDNPRCGRCKHPLPPVTITSRPVMVTDRTFNDEVLASPLPVLLTFWATWCSACATMMPVLDDLAKTYAGQLKVAKLNVEQNPATAGRYNVLSLPTSLFFRNGELADTVAGALPKQAIERYLWGFLAK